MTEDNFERFENEDFEAYGVPGESQYRRLPDQEINTIAMGLYRNEKFASWQIAEREQDLLASVFMPLMLLSAVQLKMMIRDKVAFFISDMKDAGPRAINGYPMFTSFRSLDAEDGQRVHNKVLEIVKAMKELGIEENQR